MLVKRPFSKQTLSLAVAAAIGCGAAGTSPAVSAATLDNTDRLGDAVVYQYFSAKDDWQTFFRLINTSEDAVVVKVRFREAANSREILDFEVALSPYDMWTGWTDRDAFGDGSGPGIRTNDTSCIFPPPGSSPIAGGGFKRLNGDLVAALFSDAAFTGDYADGSALDPLVRKSEGYFEIIGISQYDGNDFRSANFVNAVTHGAGGQPNCGQAFNLWRDNPGRDLSPADTAVGNVLAANAYMINVPSGQGAGYDPDIIAGCSDLSLYNQAAMTDTSPDLDDCNPTDRFAQGGNTPALNQALWNGETEQAMTTFYGIDLNQSGSIDTAPNSINLTVAIPGFPTCTSFTTEEGQSEQFELVYDAAQANLLRTTPVQACDLAIVSTPQIQTFLSDSRDVAGATVAWRQKQKGVAPTVPVTGGVDRVSWEFMRNSVINEWAASANPASVVTDYFTQWVMTFPTKHYYVDLQDDENPADDISPTLVATPFDGEYNPPLPEAFAPFSNSFAQGGNGPNEDNVAGLSCEAFELDMWNREERYSDFTSPAPFFEDALCYEVNVMTFNERYEDMGLDSNFAYTINSGNLPTDWDGEISERGWAELTFTGPGTNQGLIRGVERATRYGLPVTGFLFSVYNTLSEQTNHTTINAHKYTRDQVQGIVRTRR